MKKKIILLIVTLVIVMLGIYTVANKLGNKANFKNNQVAYVDGQYISLDEYMYYLKKGIEYYEQSAGGDVWDIKIDGQDTFDILKNEIINTVIETNIKANYAKKQGITISDDEQKVYFFDENSAVEKQYVENQILILKLKDSIISQISIEENQDLEILADRKEKIYLDTIEKIISESKSEINLKMISEIKLDEVK